MKSYHLCLSCRVRGVCVFSRPPARGMHVLYIGKVKHYCQFLNKTISLKCNTFYLQEAEMTARTNRNRSNKRRVFLV